MHITFHRQPTLDKDAQKDQKIVDCIERWFVVPEIAVRNLAMQDVESCREVVVFIGPEQVNMAKPYTGERYDDAQGYA